jgi:putative ABC transport system permease protein
VKHQFDKDGVAISEKFASGVNAKVGDTLSLTFNGKTYDLKVSLIYKAFVYNYALVYSDNPAFEGLDITYNGAWVDVKHLSDPEEVSKEIKEKSKLINTCTTQNGWKNQIKDIMSGVLVMTNAVKVFAILLALVVVYNLALMNFKERGRDIATLKVLGFSRLEIALSLLFETMTLTIVGVLFGSLLAYPFLLAVMGTNIVELVMYLYTIYPLSYFYAFLLTFFVAFLINVVFVIRTKKIKMVESLKSVE